MIRRIQRGQIQGNWISWENRRAKTKIQSRSLSKGIHKSLRSAALSPIDVETLDLTKSKDLLCKNMMCEKLGNACVCKLARFVQQTDFPNLHTLILKNNRLDVLPDAIFECLPKLKLLDVRNNQLIELPENVNPGLEIRTEGNPLEHS